jgi:hypothetical protein
MKREALNSVMAGLVPAIHVVQPDRYFRNSQRPIG